MPAPKTKTKKIPGTKNINKTKKLKVKLKILPSSVEIPENNVIAKIIEKNIQQHIKKKPTKILKKLKLKIITE
jgi:translation elongation factor EF-1beta